MHSVGTLTGQWRKDRRPVDDEGLADLGLSDTEALCECAGAIFCFTSRTVAGRGVLVELRELGVAEGDPAAIRVAAFAATGPVTALGRGSECRARAQSRNTAFNAARRSVTDQVFRSVQKLVCARQVARYERLAGRRAVPVAGADRASVF